MRALLLMLALSALLVSACGGVASRFQVESVETTWVMHYSIWAPQVEVLVHNPNSGDQYALLRAVFYDDEGVITTEDQELVTIPGGDRARVALVGREGYRSDYVFLEMQDDADMWRYALQAQYRSGEEWETIQEGIVQIPEVYQE
jgi:hypothetical protein